MKDNFAACLKQVLKSEGGKSNNRNDPGGQTNQGVTHKSYDDYRHRSGLSLRSVYSMTNAERDEIYRSDYWNKIGGDELGLGEDYTVFDAAVNSGVSRANHWMVQARKRKLFIQSYAIIRLTFLQHLRTWKSFGKGWSFRVRHVEKISLQMSEG